MNATATTIDIAALVEAGVLDLDAVFDGADWRVGDAITAYTSCVYGADGDEPGQIEIVLEKATAYGIDAYRWGERDDAGSYERGPITLDRDEAIAAGEEYAAANDEEPDVDNLISQIVATGYFGAAVADDIRAVCEVATQYSQGYLLLPRGECVGHPMGRAWTTNGYLQCEYVTLDATHPSIAYAADALLRAVTATEEE